MRQNVMRHATRPVPRYTSYPTAPHFEADFPEADYRGWLGHLDPAAPVSLYLHVPFCKQMCWYCGCNMKLASRYGPLAEYHAVLLREIDLLADALPARMSLSHLHWGGGTPTALSADDLARAMDQVNARFDFEDGAELAIESDPRTLEPDMAARIGELGFNRASFGVQEFDPKVQAAINRIQPPEMVAGAVDMLRGAGVSGINFDLIYGLPHQSADALVRTVETCADMRPDRVALFGYAHVPWMAKNQRMIPEDSLPGPEERLDQAERAGEALQQAGYQAVGIDHFALPEDGLAQAAAAGTLRRNFQGYTTDEAAALLGVGATSIGRTPRGFVQNITETGAWARAVGESRLPVARGRALSGDDELRAHVIERLMCDGAVDTEAAGRAYGFGPDWCADALDELEPLARDGLLDRDGGRIALTEAGWPLARIAASAFDTYLHNRQARHSVAV